MEENAKNKSIFIKKINIFYLVLISILIIFNVLYFFANKYSFICGDSCFFVTRCNNYNGKCALIENNENILYKK